MKVPGLDSAEVEKDLAFPVPEFERRLAELRAKMAWRELEALAPMVRP